MADHWSSEKYSAAASFVPQLAGKVMTWLAPAPGERILDLGCGDGQLTASIASIGAEALGVDFSASFIRSAKERYAAHGNCEFEHHDCTKLSDLPRAVDGSWDKVFSNAAMHWILCDPSTRHAFFENVHAALRPGGMFVFEMGGFGNVSEAVTALIAAFVMEGRTVQEARQTNPWYFPSDAWMRNMLEDVGLQVEELEMEHRPTKLTEKDAGGTGGLEGWMRLMGAQFSASFDEKSRERYIANALEMLQSVVTREDGSQWLGYVRLRAVARKPDRAS